MSPSALLLLLLLLLPVREAHGWRAEAGGHCASRTEERAAALAWRGLVPVLLAVMVVVRVRVVAHGVLERLTVAGGASAAIAGWLRLSQTEPGGSCVRAGVVQSHRATQQPGNPPVRRGIADGQSGRWHGRVVARLLQRLQLRKTACLISTPAASATLRLRHPQLRPPSVKRGLHRAASGGHRAATRN